MLGRSPSFTAAVGLLNRFARLDVPVLIQGETGTGKELAARSIHYQSARRDRPFIPINCGALPDSLIENELFGHERGAYSDARHASVGLVALADGGSLFMDEVDALSLRAQGAVLRFVQDQRYRPIGAGRERRVSVRLITASNQNLEALVRKGKFRMDLLFRIKVLDVELPPLRDRPGDARLLGEHFLGVCAERQMEARKRFHRRTLDWIDHYEWPGNVRELENFVQRECLLTEGPEIVFPRIAQADGGVPAGPDDQRTLPYRAAREAILEEFNRRFLSDVLARASGNVTRAAMQAGKERRAFGRMLKKYGIAPRDFRLRA